MPRHFIRILETEECADNGCRTVRVGDDISLPQATNSPTRSFERSIVAAIPVNVRADLTDPVARVVTSGELL